MLGDSQNCLGSSEYLSSLLGVKNSPAPYFNLDEEVKTQACVRGLIENNFINAAHDVSDGGLYTALVEMGMPSLLGFDIVSDSEIRMDAFLFGEAQGRILVSLVEDEEDNFLDYVGEQGVSCTLLGHVTKGKIHVDGEHFGFMNEAKHTFDNALEKRLAAI